MAEFPTYEQMAKNVAEKVLDEFLYHGKSIREWMKIIVDQEPKTGHWRHYEGMLICSECGTEFYDDIMEYCGDDVPKCCPNCGFRMVEPQERSEQE